DRARRPLTRSRRGSRVDDTVSQAAIRWPLAARRAPAALVGCVVALSAAVGVPPARGDVIRLSRPQALRALASPAPTGSPQVAVRVPAGAPSVTTGTASGVSMT